MTKHSLWRYLTGVLVGAALVGATTLVGQGYESSDEAATVVQYKLVPVKQFPTQQELQTLLTQQGNDGWRLVVPGWVLGPFSPTAPKIVLVFSRP